MAARTAGPSRFRTAMVLVFLGWSLGIPTGSSARADQFRVRRNLWPCRLVVKPTLLGVMEDGWARSPTLRRQCEALAAARAVVVIEWGAMPDSQSRALARMERQDGVVVAWVVVPPVPDAVGLVAHELQHVIEWTSGLDYAAESKRAHSGVWPAFAGFETAAAIEAGRQVTRELRDAPRPPQSANRVPAHDR